MIFPQLRTVLSLLQLPAAGEVILWRTQACATLRLRGGIMNFGTLNNTCPAQEHKSRSMSGFSLKQLNRYLNLFCGTVFNSVGSEFK